MTPTLPPAIFGSHVFRRAPSSLVGRRCMIPRLVRLARVLRRGARRSSTRLPMPKSSTREPSETSVRASSRGGSRRRHGPGPGHERRRWRCAARRRDQDPSEQGARRPACGEVHDDLQCAMPASTTSCTVVTCASSSARAVSSLPETERIEFRAVLDCERRDSSGPAAPPSSSLP